MSADRSPSTAVVGLAFFSMLFGSGNLIFPLVLGAQFQSYFLICAAGFVITAVILPTLGILAMVPAQGRYEELCQGLLPMRYARWFFLALLVFWIPLGSGPRCAVLAHASISEHLPIHLPIWLFSLIFLLLVYAAIGSRRRIIALLGQFLTPALLLAIFLIVIASFFHGDIDSSPAGAWPIFLESIVDGYYTQDLIAAIFFSAALVSMLKLDEQDRSVAVKKTLYGGLLAAAMLAVIYTALMAASAVHAESLAGLSGDRLVSRLANIALGPRLGAISSIAVTLACFTTEIALVIVFADFLDRHLLSGGKNRQAAIVITLIIIWSMSQLEFGGIMAVVAPAMKILYPILFALVLRYIWRSRRRDLD